MVGVVSADGSIASGSGFTVAEESPGRYRVMFTTPFPSTPVVVVTPVFGSITVDAGTSVTAEHAVVDQQDTGSCLVATFNVANALTPLTFEFHAISVP